MEEKQRPAASPLEAARGVGPDEVGEEERWRKDSAGARPACPNSRTVKHQKDEGGSGESVERHDVSRTLWGGAAGAALTALYALSPSVQDHEGGGREALVESQRRRKGCGKASERPRGKRMRAFPPPVRPAPAPVPHQSRACPAPTPTPSPWRPRLASAGTLGGAAHRARDASSGASCPARRCTRIRPRNPLATTRPVDAVTTSELRAY